MSEARQNTHLEWLDTLYYVIFAKKLPLSYKYLEWLDILCYMIPANENPQKTIHTWND